MGAGPAGIAARVGLSFYDPNSKVAPVDGNGRSLVDPTAITVTIVDPNGTKTNYTLAGGQVVKDSQGLYHLTLDTTGLPGHWLVGVKCPSPVQVGGVGSFDIDPNPLA